MKLRGIEFGPISNASGGIGFGVKKGGVKEYLHHLILEWLGLLNFTGCGFTAKTTTLPPRLDTSEAPGGNMPMKEDGITPKEITPRCILPNLYWRTAWLSIKMFLKGIMLNAVGLSGPGAKALLETGEWQKRTEPFFISFMAVGKTPEERILELRGFVELFKSYLPRFMAKVGLQINYSCPNVGLDPSHLVDEIRTGLQIASVLGIPLVVKINILVPVEIAKEIADDSNCDALCVSNTIPFGKMPEIINWKKLFGSDISPLAGFGGGGLSGKHLLPLVVNWIDRARKIGIKKPIQAGGGIMHPLDVDLLHAVGADSVFVGSVATLRPWRVKSIIRRAHQLFEKE